MKKILAQAKASEDELKSIGQNATLFNPRLVTLREKLKQSYLRLVSLDQRAAHGISRNVWKLVFYATIERLRRQQKQVETSTETSARDKQQHREIFSNFLGQAEQFYRQVITEVQQTYGNIGVVLPGEDKSKKKEKGSRFLSDSNAICYFTCYESLLFLGDILRYAQIHLKPHSQQSFKYSTLSYRQAAYLCPQSGNPHNQLSVIFLHNKDDLRAVYHNYRAFYAETPFPTAKTNFKVLFEKIITKRDNAERVQGFSVNRCVLHFLLASAAPFVQVQDKDFEEAYYKFLYQFKQFCEFPPEEQRGHLSRNPKKEVKDSQIIYFYIRVAVLTICNVHTAMSAAKAKKRKRGDGAMDDLLRKYLLIALTVLEDLVQSCIKANKVSALALPAIKVFTSWLRHNQYLLQLLEDEQLQPRYKNVLDSMTRFLKDVQTQVKAEVYQSSPLYGLMEDVELRGFTPILLSQKAMTHEVWQCAQRPVESTYRKCVRVVRLMDDVKILTGKMDLFPIQQTSHPDLLLPVEENEIQVWKGKDFTPVPAGVFPSCREEVMDELKSVFKEDPNSIADEVFSVLCQKHSLVEQYMKSLRPGNLATIETTVKSARAMSEDGTATRGESVFPELW